MIKANEMQKALVDPELQIKIIEEHKLPLDQDNDKGEQVIYNNHESILNSSHKVIKLLINNANLNLEDIIDPDCEQRDRALLRMV